MNNGYHVPGWDNNEAVGEIRDSQYRSNEDDDSVMDGAEDETHGEEVSEGGPDYEGEGPPVGEAPPVAQFQPQRTQSRSRGPAIIEEDILLLKETASIFPYALWRNQRREAWQAVANNVNLSLRSDRHFDVCRIRERIKTLYEKHKRHELVSLRASGTVEEYGEHEQLLTDFSERMDDVDNLAAATRAEREEEERQAGVLREAALEGMRRVSEPGDTTEDAQPDASQHRGLGQRGRREGRSRGAVLKETLAFLLQEDRDSREREAEARSREAEAAGNHSALLERFLEQQERRLTLEGRRLELEEHRNMEQERRNVEYRQDILHLMSLLANRGS